jgi:hypothetical protein
MRWYSALAASAAVLGLVLAAPAAAAQELRPTAPPSCNCTPPQVAPRAPQPRLTDLSRTPLDIFDEVAALDAIRIALTQVGDGSSFVWYRNNGRLSGVVQPTRSFRDGEGRICRHIVVILTTGPRTSKVEGFGCRLPDGNWQLES